MKESYRNFLGKLPGGTAIYRATRSVKDWFKRVLLPGTLFENMGLFYLGPVDGHDLPELIRVLRVAREINRPVLVHVLTHKGHGYKPAEEQPSKFHGVGKFDPVSGETQNKSGQTFSDAFGEEMVSLAKENPTLCAITAAMPGGTGLLKYQNAFPKRLFDVGIAEEHAISMAGGLAKQGMVPVVALYSTFLQRGYDQILQDISMLNLHAIFAVDRAGLVGEDGETHHGVFDVGFLRQMPGVKVLCPASCNELKDMLRWAVRDCNGPVAIRYPRGGDRGYSDSAWAGGPVCCHRRGKDVTIITYGAILENVMQAADILAQNGIEATVLRLLTVSLLPVEEIIQNLRGNVLVVEETAAGCGVFEELSSYIRDRKIAHLDLGRHFVTHGSLPELYRAHGLDAEGIANTAMEVHQSEN